MNDSNEGDKSKFKITFSGDTHITKQEIGDKEIHTDSYSEVYNTNLTTITIDEGYLQKMSPDFSKSLLDFLSELNQEIPKDDKIVSDSKAPVKQSLNELAREATDIHDNKIDEKKKESIREKMRAVSMALVKMSPKIAMAIVKVTPLSPFADLIGETLEKMVSEALAK